MAGLDGNTLTLLDHKLALRRVRFDVRSDFIYAPHIEAVYTQAGDELWDRLQGRLRSGSYEAGLPISLEVIKASGHGRPGTTLNPFDRLTYQLLVDTVAPTADKLLVKRQVFSNRLLKKDPRGYMFELPGECYGRFRDKVQHLCRLNKYNWVLKADVAAFFDRIYQHNLINALASANCDRGSVNLLEKVLLAFTQKDSHGIVQGLFPSDFLGNFYLFAVDAKHSMEKLRFVRYVDDMYIFFENQRKASKHLVVLGQWLREIGLNLNEAKTRIMKADDLILEETEVDRLFYEAKKFLTSYYYHEDIYHTVSDWDEPAELDEGPMNNAEETDTMGPIRVLFDSEGETPATRDKIDKFCLPAFSAEGDDYAVPHVIQRFVFAPHLAQFYARYLSKLISNSAIRKEVEKLLRDKRILYEYQRMWLFAALFLAPRLKSSTVDLALKCLQDRNHSEALRAVCAVLVGKFGGPDKRQHLKAEYQGNSEYVRAAILYAAGYSPPSERRTRFGAWAVHSDLNEIIVVAAKKSVTS